ncbi:MAG TPA: MFS transporter [Thermomicrobiaceae bacterium]|nr:MFS transporter [Thermomicrobiaceae bacterium]
MVNLPPALRHRDFRIFWGGALLSALGSAFTTVALLWHLYLLTNSALQVGLIGLAQAIPLLSVSLFGGLLADAVDRRRLLIVTQLVQFTISGSLAVLTVAGLVTPLTLYAAAALFALASALGNPSSTALVPNLVPPSDLGNAIALNSTERSVAAILGPGLAGVLLAWHGPALCYGVDAVSWFAMVAALLAIRGRPQATGGRRGVSVEALRGGIAFVRQNPVILSMMVLDFGATLFGEPDALLPIFASHILSVGAAGLGLLFAATSVGSLVAGTGMSLLPSRQRAGRWVLSGVVVYGVAACVFALSHVFWLSLLMLAMMGAGDTVSAVLRGTINQLLTPDALRGRVSSVNSLFVIGGPRLGQVESGLVAAAAGAPISALTGGIGALLVVLGIALVPGVRRLSLIEDAKEREVAAA